MVDVNQQNISFPAVGFISAPAWHDPAPYEFTTAVEERVLTQQAFPLLPEFDYSLESIASEIVAERFCLCAKTLKASGCHLVVQVGSPFAWAKAKSELQARQRNKRIRLAANIPSIMNALAIVDALRAHQVSNIAVCSYYNPSWKKGFVDFLELCGFQVSYAASFSEQGLMKEGDVEKLFKDAWNSPSGMIKTSVALTRKSAPEAEAIVITGTGVRTLEILCELEIIARCPVIPADTVLYWLGARYLNLTLSPQMGCFQNLPLHPE
jgi:maleate cis-trans isomerase